MKMFFVVYAEASDESVSAAFKEAGYKSYTKIHGATGEGQESEPKLDTHFWPGRNNTLMLAVPDEEIQKLIGLVRRLRAEQPRAGLRAFTFPLEECV
ncbi:MAG: putative cytosolic protein [Syntrophaceae bacterium]|nr:MAG: putative cytosolic protein [Syntrophaceae bacterium]